MPLSQQPIAIVTGGGKGIGRGVALQLAKDGYTVVINGRNVDPANTTDGPYEVKKTVESQNLPGKIAILRADISSREDRKAIVDFVEQNFGRFDLLVNNAGVAPEQRKDMLEASEESFDRLISINLKGPYFLTQAVANKMIANQKAGIVKTPRICFITSISAYTSSVFRGEYCVSKAGLSMASTLFADRLAEFNIPVLQIAPGIIETSMTGPVKAKYDKLIAEGLLPTKRWGYPEDIGKVVSNFARGDLDYSTGSILEVGGGFGIKRL